MDVHTDITVTKPAFDDAPNARSWKVFADAINHAWRKSAGSFIAVGQLLNEANAELPRDAFNAMVKLKLDFAPSVARKLIRIATNPTICSHENKVPPAWTVMYVLSQVPEAMLKAAFADGTIHPGMSLKDAMALKPSKNTTSTTSKAKPSPSAPAALNDVWQTASQEERRAFLDQLGRDGLCEAMSTVLMADLRDYIVDVTIAGASKSSAFATRCTDLLHSALAIAEQPEPGEEGLRRIMALLRLIAKKATAKGIARSDVVIAEGKPKGRK